MPYTRWKKKIQSHFEFLNIAIILSTASYFGRWQDRTLADNLELSRITWCAR